MKKLVYLILVSAIMCSCIPVTREDIAKIKRDALREQSDAYLKESKEFTLIPKKSGLDAIKIVAKEKQQIRYDKRESGKIITEFTPYWAIINKDCILFTYHQDDYSVIEEYIKL